MGTELPKVLVPLCGQQMIRYILDALSKVEIDRPIIVIGENGKAIRETIGDAAIYAVQKEPRGSGDAVASAVGLIGNKADVLVMCGDSPLFKVETIQTLMSTHRSQQATITLAASILTDPFGYGRIVRDEAGNVSGIVEEKMATEEQKRLNEVNGGCYAFDASWLKENIGRLAKNEAGEYCLTEMVDIALSQSKSVVTVQCGQEEIWGVNTPEQLDAAERVLKCRNSED